MRLESIAKDVNLRMDGGVWGDASAALGIINRKGIGKTWRIDSSLVWVQQLVAERRLEFVEMLGRDNPAGLFTKHSDWETIAKHCREFLQGISFLVPSRAGRHRTNTSLSFGWFGT